MTPWWDDLLGTLYDSGHSPASSPTLLEDGTCQYRTYLGQSQSDSFLGYYRLCWSMARWKHRYH